MLSLKKLQQMVMLFVDSSIASDQAQIDSEFLLLKLTLHFHFVFLKIVNTESQKGGAE